jgi:outer membrane protein assembly factor BamA
MWGRGDLDNPVRLFDQIVGIGIDRQKKVQRKLADIIVTPDLEGFLNTDFSQRDTIINRGYVAAKELMPEIAKNVSELQGQSQPDNTIDADVLPFPVVFQAKKNASDPEVKNVIFELNKTKFPVMSRDSLVSRLFSLLHERKMPFARAVVSAFDSGTIVTIDPGVIENIVMEGNDHTSSRLIRITSGLRKGSVLNEKKIEDAVSSLYASDLFRTVNIYVDSICTVHIKVVEKEYWRSRLGLRFDEYHLLEGYIQPAYENLFGTALCASLHLQYGKRREKYAFELAADRPWSINWANNISLQSYIARERIIDIEQTEELDTVIGEDSIFITDNDYNEKSLLKTGFLFMLGAQLGRIVMIDGSIRLERFRLEQTESGVFDALGPFKKGIRFAKLRFTVDHLDKFPFPQKGQKHYISIGGASDIIGGTENFITVQGRLQYYFTFMKRHTCSPLIMFSWADQSLPPVEQVHIGGSLPEEKYRDMGVYHYVPFVGLKPRAISGDIMVLLHGLYRFAITKKIFLTALVDWGYAWNQDNLPDRPEFDFDTKTAKHFVENAPVGIGLGFAVQTPVGPLKLSWGRVIYGSLKEDFGIDKENVIYFSAGYDF